MRFDLTSLNLVLAIAETHSITQGAQRMHLALAAASKRLQDLESRLGVQIFNRHARGVRLTPAGEALVRHVRSLQGALVALESEVSEFAQGVRGHVRIAANASAIAEFLPAELARYVAQYEDVRISLEEQVSTEVQRMVREGFADIGIFVAAADWAVPDGLYAKPYRQGRVAAVVPKASPLAKKRTLRLADMLPYDFVELQAGAAMQEQLFAAAAELGLPLRARIQVRGFEAVAQLVSAGLGVAVMPELVAKRLATLFEIKVCALNEPWATRHYWLASRPLESISAASRRFVELLTEANSETN